MSPKRQPAGRKWPLVVFFAVVLLVAVVSGYVLERYILGSVVATKGKTVTTPQVQVQPAKVEITVPAISLYRVQVASLSGKQQADQYALAVKQKGFGAFVTGTGPCKVVAGVTKSRDAAQKLTATLTKSGYKPMISEYKITGGSYTATFADPEYAIAFRGAVKSLGDAMPAAGQAWDAYYNNKKTDFLNLSGTLAATLADVSQKLSGAAPPKGSEQLNSALQSLLEKASGNATDTKSFADKGGKDMYVKASTAYMEVLDAFEKLLTQIK